MSLKQFLEQKEKEHSPFENALRTRKLELCSVFRQGDAIRPCSFEKGESGVDVGQATNRPLGSKTVAVLFSGGPAAGGHNVLVGIKAGLGTQSTLYGIKSGPKGLIEGDLFEITDSMLKEIVNLGGFDFLGSDRTKIKTDEQITAVKNTVTKFKLQGLVVVGGDDSNTNAAMLAEELRPLGCTVVGVPKTIDGDLQVGKELPISFGFDTATKIYAEMVGNVLKDTPSSRKYWHFVKLMGRSASHVALEVALQTHPHVTLISEEVLEKKQTLDQVVTQIAQVIAFRAGKGKAFGVVLVPEGLIEFIPELKDLVSSLNRRFGECESLTGQSFETKKQTILQGLDVPSVALFNSLPERIQETLLLDRDAHGNLKVSQIPTESLLIELCSKKLNHLQANVSELNGTRFKLSSEESQRLANFKFNTVSHFFGYEGRCGAPSVFDASFTFNLGVATASLILSEKTGSMAAITNFGGQSQVLGLKLHDLIKEEMREGKPVKVIEKALVELDSPAFNYFETRRNDWAKDDCFSSPGPRQYWGDTAKQLPLTVALNQGYSKLDFNFGDEVTPL